MAFVTAAPVTWGVVRAPVHLQPALHVPGAGDGIRIEPQCPACLSTGRGAQRLRGRAAREPGAVAGQQPADLEPGRTLDRVTGGRARTDRARPARRSQSADRRAVDCAQRSQAPARRAWSPARRRTEQRRVVTAAANRRPGGQHPKPLARVASQRAPARRPDRSRWRHSAPTSSARRRSPLPSPRKAISRRCLSTPRSASTGSLKKPCGTWSPMRKPPVPMSACGESTTALISPSLMTAAVSTLPAATARV